MRPGTQNTSFITRNLQSKSSTTPAEYLQEDGISWDSKAYSHIMAKEMDQDKERNSQTLYMLVFVFELQNEEAVFITGTRAMTREKADEKKGASDEKYLLRKYPRDERLRCQFEHGSMTFPLPYPISFHKVELYRPPTAILLTS